MKYIAALAKITPWLFVGIAAYCYFFFPPIVLKHKTAAALHDFSKAIATQDRTKIGEALQTLLADKAQLKLQVQFFSLSQTDGKPAAQDFDKQSFIAFVDTLLYSLTDYSYRPELRDLTLSVDRKTADITFTSRESAEGLSYNAGIGVDMRFSSDTTCTGHVIFENKKPQLDKADCTVKLRAEPKPPAH